MISSVTGAKRTRVISIRTRQLIVEGILVFENEALRNFMDIKVFVDTDADLRFIRRLSRDMRERGRTVESVVEQYLSLRCGRCTRNLLSPPNVIADVIIPEGGYNEVGIDLVIQKIRSLVPSEARTARKICSRTSQWFGGACGLFPSGQ